MTLRTQSINTNEIIKSKNFQKGYKDCRLVVSSYDDTFYVCTLYTAIPTFESCRYVIGFKYAINVLESALPPLCAKMDVWSASEILRQHMKEITK